MIGLWNRLWNIKPKLKPHEEPCPKCGMGSSEMVARYIPKDTELQSIVDSKYYQLKYHAFVAKEEHIIHSCRCGYEWVTGVVE